MRSIKQRGYPRASVEFDGEDIDDFFFSCKDRGLKAGQFGNIWIHTHPSGMKATPSSVDVNTFNTCFSGCPWSVMAIVAKDGDTSALLRFNVGPRADIQIPILVDWANWHKQAEGPARDEWEKEFTDKIKYKSWTQSTTPYHSGYGRPYSSPPPGIHGYGYRERYLPRKKEAWYQDAAGNWFTVDEDSSVSKSSPQADEKDLMKLSAPSDNKDTGFPPTERRSSNNGGFGEGVIDQYDAEYAEYFSGTSSDMDKFVESQLSDADLQELKADREAIEKGDEFLVGSPSDTLPTNYQCEAAQKEGRFARQ